MSDLEIVGEVRYRDDSPFIDEYNLRLDGWARYSADELRRYRLARVFTAVHRVVIDGAGKVWGAYRDVDGCSCVHPGPWKESQCRAVKYGLPFTSDDWCNCRCHALCELDRVAFVLCNPSTATAWKGDRTVDKCCLFAQRWGAQAIEVVNLYAFRSTYPEDLDRASDLGIDEIADQEILAACRGAKRVIAGWGNNGWRMGRAAAVRKLLEREGIELMHLGLTQSGVPMHPLARGKNYIPLDREPVVWS